MGSIEYLYDNGWALETIEPNNKDGDPSFTSRRGKGGKDFPSRCYSTHRADTDDGPRVDKGFFFFVLEAPVSDQLMLSGSSSGSITKVWSASVRAAQSWTRQLIEVLEPMSPYFCLSEVANFGIPRGGESRRSGVEGEVRKIPAAG